MEFFRWLYASEQRPYVPHRDRPDECIHYDYHLFTPIDDRHCLDIQFDCGAYSPLSLGMAKISDFIKRVINTVVIEPSLTVKQRQVEIRQRYPHDTLSTIRQPEDWVCHGWKYGVSSPRRVSQDSRKETCTTLGIKFGKINLNKRDLNLPDTRRNVIAEIAKLSAPVVLTGGAGATAALLNPLGLQGLVTKAARFVETAAALVACGCAVAVAAQAGYTKVSASFLAMRALATSTFGRGNEFWYENDKSLLNQLST